MEEDRRRLPLLAALESPSQLEGIDDVIRIPQGYIKRPRDRKKDSSFTCGSFLRGDDFGS